MGHRRTLHIDQGGDLADVLSQIRYTARDLSHVISAITGGGPLSLNTQGMWLGGPYPSIGGLVKLGGVGYKLDAGSPCNGLTLYAPLSLVQAKSIDSATWSVMGADSALPYHLLGWLCDESAPGGTIANSDGSLDDAHIDVTALPTDPGGGGIGTRTDLIVGRIVVVDTANESTPLYNSANPPVPINTNQSRERMCILELDLLSSAQQTDTVPNPPAVTSGWHPLFQLTVTHDGGIIDVQLHKDAKVAYDTRESIGFVGFTGPGATPIVLPWESGVMGTFDNPSGGLTTIEGQLTVICGAASLTDIEPGKPMIFQIYDFDSGAILGMSVEQIIPGEYRTLQCTGYSITAGKQRWAARLKVDTGGSGTSYTSIVLPNTIASDGILNPFIITTQKS